MNGYTTSKSCFTPARPVWLLPACLHGDRIDYGDSETGLDRCFMFFWKGLSGVLFAALDVLTGTFIPFLVQCLYSTGMWGVKSD